MQKALLENGEMLFPLYEFDLKEFVEDWKNNIATSGMNFFFAITKNSNDVAMVLTTKRMELYINEEGRDKLKQFWKENYENNIKLFLPGIVQDLTDAFLVQIDKYRRQHLKIVRPCKTTSTNSSKPSKKPTAIAPRHIIWNCPKKWKT